MATGMSGLSRGEWRPAWWVVSVSLVGAVLGCNDLTGSHALPAGTPNPAVYNTAAGALGMRNAALFQVATALPQYIIDAGLLTDELEDYATGASHGTLIGSQNQGLVPDPLDERILPLGVTVGSYGNLQAIRTLSAQALGALALYDTAATARDSMHLLRGELYAMQGYAEILLADLFCSGVPLSTLVFQHDYVYAPSSTWQQVYLAARAQMDTAVLLARTSPASTARDSLLYLAAVLKGRVYLDLGNYPAAADDVASVPNGFQYQFELKWIYDVSNRGFFVDRATIADTEGHNGLPFLSSGDPRSAAVTVVQPDPSNGGPYIPLTFPQKYASALIGNGYAPFTVASGIEARLIEAENELQPASAPHGPWLATLNALRTNAPALTNGLVPMLPRLTDPGVGLPSPAADTARVALLFRERAYWLFVDGHRQGDLRRLIRQYGAQYHAAFGSDERVYPSGRYLAPGTGVYGTDVTAPIPPTENINPNFHGCLSRAP